MVLTVRRENVSSLSHATARKTAKATKMENCSRHQHHGHISLLKANSTGANGHGAVCFIQNVLAESR